MKNSEMSETERENCAQLIAETKPATKRHRHRLTIASIVAFLAVLGLTIWYWIRPDITCSTSLSPTGHLYGLYGALLLVVGAVSKPSTIALMSMTRYGHNSKLFTELMNSRLNARVGVMFVVVAFSIHAATILTFGN